ncbi:MAG: hypothetical protein RL577_582 [Bacteroidota bacterium]|jgi:hypothetical protein
MQRVFLWVVLILIQNASWGQDKKPFGRRVLDYYLGEAQESKPRFLAYPTLAYAPETKLELGLSSLYVFHSGRDTTARLSEINAFAFLTQEKQKGLWLDHALYGEGNAWLGMGRIRIMDYPLHYYGVGSEPPVEPLAIVSGQSVSIRERWMKQLRKDHYFGLEFDYQSMSNVAFDLPSHVIDFEHPLGASGSRNMGLGLGWVYDTRPNVLNSRHGNLLELAFLHYSARLGSQHPMNTVFVDARHFATIGPNKVLAVHGLGQFSAGNVPFNQMSLLGGESIMRGHYLGRLRSEQMVAIQAELRALPFSWSRRLGGAVFASLGSVSEQWPFYNWSASAGAGLRYLLFPEKDVYTRIDLGFHSAGYGLYFYIGEAF